MLPNIREHLLSHWPGRRVEGCASPTLHFLRVGELGGFAEENSVVFLCFVGNESYPRFVIKAAKSTSYSDAVRREHANLVRATELIAFEGVADIPTPLDLFEVDGCAVLVESFLKGRGFLAEVRADGGPFHRRRVARELELATRWAELCERASRRNGPILTGAHIYEMARIFRSGSRPTDAESRFLAFLEEATQMLRLRMPPAHGDFYAGNLLSVGGRIRLYDWAFFEESLVPLFDYVMLAISRPVSGLNDPGFPETALVANNDTALVGWYAALLRQCVDRLLRGLNLDTPNLFIVWGVALLAGSVKDWSIQGSRPSVAACFRRHFGTLAVIWESGHG